MAPKKSKATKTKAVIKPLQPALIERFDEANSARLGLICAQERIPSDYTRWDIEMPIEDRVTRLTCIAPTEYGGVPHGLDGDFATALNLMYLEQQSPASGEVNVTAYQLLQKAGFTDSGQYYQALQESLDRLKAATYTASESWRDKRYARWTTVKFNIIEQIEADTEGGMTYGSGTTLRIRLARPVVDSLREQYVKPLDLTFMQSLKRSITRSVYRLLDARRYDPLNITEPVALLRMPLVQWANECKMIETVPARIKRNLDGAHHELIERGYLKSVTYEGSRTNTIIQYEFGDVPSTLPAPEPSLQLLPDSPLVEALRRHGVALPVARKLVSEYGDQHVTLRLEKFEAMLAGGYRPQRPYAVLVDVIKDQEGKYVTDTTAPLPSNVELTPNLKRRTLKKTVDTQIEAEAEALNRRIADEFDALPLPEQAARTVTQVRMFVGRELRDRHLQSLHAALLSGEIEPATVYREVTKAASELRLPEFAEEIRNTFSDRA